MNLSHLKLCTGERPFLELTLPFLLCPPPCPPDRYGKTYNTAQGAGFNLVGVKDSQFLIQQNWDEASQSCQTRKK